MPEARLYLACQGDEILAGIIILCHDKRAIYAYGASIKDREKLRLRPNDLLFWHIIHEMKSAGYEFFDFGTTPASNEGLLHFKENWGAESRRLAYAYWLNTAEEIPVVDRDSKMMAWANALIRRMPLWLLRITGNLFFKQLG
jgi:lipid II:glycine glycyltransferase (peptidoglycan interpeptide bridge formation enzyme)